jgi:hypothetical protein
MSNNKATGMETYFMARPFCDYVSLGPNPMAREKIHGDGRMAQCFADLVEAVSVPCSPQ